MAKTIQDLERDVLSWWPPRYRAAAEELTRTGDPRAVKALIVALERPFSGWHPGKRLALVRALGHLADECALVPVASLLLNGKASAGSDLHRAAIDGVRRMLEHACSPGPVVRVLWRAPCYTQAWPPGLEEAVMEALIRMDRALVVPIIRVVRDHIYWTDDLSSLTQASAFAPVLGALALFGMPARRRVILGWAGLAPATIEPLFDLLQQLDRRTRLWAADALGLIGTQPVVERLERLFGGADVGRRLAAAVGLAHAGDPRELGLLVAAVADPQAEVCIAAAGALGRLGWFAAPALGPLEARARAEDDREVRAALQDAVRQIESALRDAPTELEAAQAPQGLGIEPEASSAPDGRGTEPEAGATVS